MDTRTTTRSPAPAVAAGLGLPALPALLALLALTVSVAGCASMNAAGDVPAGTAAGDGAAPDLTTSPEKLLEPDLWRLVEIDARPLAVPDGDRPPYLVFEPEGDRVHGYAGCNRFSGGVEPERGGRIRFRDVAATRMACAGPENAIENAFLAALEGADSFRVVDRVLELRRDGMLPLAVFEAVYGAEE